MSAAELNETITYWLPVSNDGFGGKGWAAGVVTSSKSALVNEQTFSPDGKTIIANSAVYTEAQIPNGAYISPTEHAGAVEPTSNAGEVVRVVHIPAMSPLRRMLVRYP